MRIDGHVDVPFVGLEEVKVEAGKEGGDAHVEFCVCETERVLVWSRLSLWLVGGCVCEREREKERESE